MANNRRQRIALTHQQEQDFYAARRTERTNELKRMQGLRPADNFPDGRRLAGTQNISAAAQKVLGYATHFTAQNLADRRAGAQQITPALSKRVVNRLVRGTETQDYTRSVLPIGPGNVRGSDTREAVARSRLAYQYFGRDQLHKQAANIELIRGGNCDHHGLISAIHAGGHLPDDQEHVSSVRDDGHAFAELRGSGGKRQVRDSDVIVDSWSTSDHAILRMDSEFATDMHPTPLDDTSRAFTKFTHNRREGAEAFRKKQRYKDQLLTRAFDEVFDERTQQKMSSTDLTRFDTWDPTSSISDDGQQAIDTRKRTFDRQNAITRNIQTFFTARKMGANIRGAGKHAVFRDE